MLSVCLIFAILSACWPPFLALLASTRPSAYISPNSITPTVTERGESRGHKQWQIMKPWSFGESRRHKSRKSRTQTISTCQDACDKVCYKPVWVALMEFSSLQCMGKVGDKVRDKFPTKSQTCCWHKSWKYATQITSPTFMIRVRNFLRELVADFVAKSTWWNLGYTQRCMQRTTLQRYR